MPRHLPALLATCCASAAALALAACGGSTDSASKTATRTVYVRTPPASQATATQGSSTSASSAAGVQSTTPTTPVTTSPATSTSGGASAPGREPSFVGPPTSGDGTLGAAVATLHARGYQPAGAGDFHSDQTLQVLIGVRNGSAASHDQRAFFFEDGRYLGTDAKDPSAAVKVVSQSDTEVVLSYDLYKPSDPLCCPTAGAATVHFVLDNGRLTAIDPIPSAASGASPTRN